jgi:hydrogenase maturation protease
VRRTTVIGIGSPHGDDQAGWLAIEALQARLPEAQSPACGLTICKLDRPGIALLDALQGCDRAVLVDALQGGAAPGSLLRLTRHDLQTCAAPASSHGIGVVEALALGEALHRLPPAVRMIGIAIGSAIPGLAPTPVTRQAAALLGARLARWIRAGDEAALDSCLTSPNSR